MKVPNPLFAIVALAVFIAEASLLGSQTAHAQEPEGYDFEKGRLVVRIDQSLDNDVENYKSYTKKLSLERGGADLTVTVTVISDKKKPVYYMMEFVTSGAPSLDRSGGQGYSMALWPYSSVWNLQRYTQAIYARGEGIDKMIVDLQTKFNGTDKNPVAFTATGDATKGTLVITMKKKTP